MSQFPLIVVPSLHPDLLAKAQTRIEELYYLVRNNWEGFIEREGQVMFIKMALETLLNARTSSNTVDNGSNIAAIEAGTGTGKTIGYCLAALVASEILNVKVVVSTATVTLQEQLFFKDLPRLAQFVPGVTFSLLKGRSRYVCKSKLESAVQGEIQEDWLGMSDDDDLEDRAKSETTKRKVDEKTVLWMKDVSKALDSGKWNGEFDGLGNMPDEADWKLISADAHACHAQQCAHFKECTFFSARRAAEGVSIQVANHSLVLAALSNESPLFDAGETLFIFDEAHHLPDIANDQFGHSIGLAQSRKVLVALRKSMAAGARLLPVGDRPDLAATATTLATIKDALLRLEDFILESNIISQEAPLYRFPHGEMTAELTQESSQMAHMLASVLNVSADLRSLLTQADESLSPKEKEGRAKAASDIGSHQRLGVTMRDLFNAWSSNDSIPLAKWMMWMDGHSTQDVKLCSSPLTGAPGLHKGLWRQVSAAVCTSATLSACGNFDFFARLSGLNRLPAHHSGIMPSPFDYPTQGLLQLPRLKHSPKSAGYPMELASRLPDLLREHSGGQLMLFTSKRQMEASFDALPDDLKPIVLMQNTLSRQNLLKTHIQRVKAGKPSIIFGLQGFGEGVDLPGNLCEHVLIDKLPFTPPTSPVDEALSEWLATQGRDAFAELSVPRTSMRLAQWVGRAVRTVHDHATITILDNRLGTTAYGRRILDGLPPFARA
jgi:ATP-dependent DNA helicase DinG